MATHTLTPYDSPSPNRPTDLETLEVISSLFAETGRPASVTTLRRWIRTDHISTWPDPTDPRGRRQLASYSDMLIAHRDHQHDRRGLN